MYFSKALYQSRDAHLWDTLDLVFSQSTTVKAYGRVETINDQYVLVVLNDQDQRDAPFIRKGIAQRKIERFMDNLAGKMALPRHNYKDRRGEKSIICEPRDLVSALFTMTEDAEYNKGLSLAAKGESIRDRVASEVRSADNLTITAQNSSRMVQAPRLQ